MKQKYFHSKKKPILRIGNLYIGKAGLLITFFTMLLLIIILLVAVVFLIRLVIYYAEGDSTISQDAVPGGYSYTLISVTPSNCSLLNYSNTTFNIQLNYSAYSSFDELKISLYDVGSDTPSASATVSATESNSIVTLSVSKTNSENYITIKIYGTGPFFSSTGSKVLLLTAVYSLG